MKQVKFPKEVLTWDFEIGQDSTGDPAVWIWMVVIDSVAGDPEQIVPLPPSTDLGASLMLTCTG